jgi:hypothetical protein
VQPPATPDQSLVMSRKAVRVRSSALLLEDLEVKRRAMPRPRYGIGAELIARRSLHRMTHRRSRWLRRLSSRVTAENVRRKEARRGPGRPGMVPAPRNLVTISEDRCAEMTRVFRLSKAAKSDRDLEQYLVWLWELWRPGIAHTDQWAEPLLPRIR